MTLYQTLLEVAQLGELETVQMTSSGKMEDDDPDTDGFFFFTSTLLILESINGSSLTCIASVGGSLSQGNTTIILSGMYWVGP